MNQKHSTQLRKDDDTMKTCPICHEPVAQDGIGRRRLYCSDACKQTAYRSRHQHKHPARQKNRREYNTVRTDKLENRIAFYEAQQRYIEAEAIRWLASEISAPISDDEIRRAVAMYRNTLK